MTVRELEKIDVKSSHCARAVMPRKCCSWQSRLQTSMDPFGGRKATCRYQKRELMVTIQGQLQFEHVALLLATYKKLVHWLQVLTKACDGRLTFVSAHLHMQTEPNSQFTIITPLQLNRSYGKWQAFCYPKRVMKNNESNLDVNLQV